MHAFGLEDNIKLAILVLHNVAFADAAGDHLDHEYLS
jgi:hypothetical protein